MLTRSEVFEIINKERAYQDRAYLPEAVLASGATRTVRDLDVAPGITLLEAYVRKATNAWVNGRGEQVSALKYVAKIAAIAVRVLERASDSDSLLNGLR